MALETAGHFRPLSHPVWHPKEVDKNIYHEPGYKVVSYKHILRKDSGKKFDTMANVSIFLW